MNPSDDPLVSLKDIHLPPDPSWWPPAPGWWGLGIIIFVVIWIGVKLWRNYRLNALPSKAFIEQLNAIKLSDNAMINHQALIRMSSLTRQYAITRYGRQRVAGLTGNNWIKFLDQTTDKPLFAENIGRLLSRSPYQSSTDEDLSTLKNALLIWAKQTSGKLDPVTPAAGLESD